MILPVLYVLSCATDMEDYIITLSDAIMFKEAEDARK